MIILDDRSSALTSAALSIRDQDSLAKEGSQEERNSALEKKDVYTRARGHSTTVSAPPTTTATTQEPLENLTPKPQRSALF